jgi:hypothetical protein
LDIELGHVITGIVGRQVDDDTVVDVRPVGMMVGFVGEEGHAGHEAERFGKVLEAELPMQRAVLLDPSDRCGCHGLHGRRWRLTGNPWPSPPTGRPHRVVVTVLSAILRDPPTKPGPTVHTTFEEPNE